MSGTTQILLITGPAGVGKSTLTWEMATQLGAAEVAHAVIETDELDRIYPRPSGENLERLWPGTTDISSRNLAAIWSNYRALNHSRLIMSGVMVHVKFDLRWIADAIPEASITVVRLQATESTLRERLDTREIGSGRDDQIRRSLRQAKLMAEQGEAGVLVVPTDGASPKELSTMILKRVGWLNPAPS
jgi:ribose 1,5-bisphosphokinase PhnN